MAKKKTKTEKKSIGGAVKAAMPASIAGLISPAMGAAEVGRALYKYATTDTPKKKKAPKKVRKGAKTTQSMGRGKVQSTPNKGL